jgi:hypothetical protein
MIDALMYGSLDPLDLARHLGRLCTSTSSPAFVSTR